MNETNICCSKVMIIHLFPCFNVNWKTEPQICNPSNYLSGKCGGTTRVGVLVGGTSFFSSQLS